MKGKAICVIAIGIVVIIGVLAVSIYSQDDMTVPEGLTLPIDPPQNPIPQEESTQNPTSEAAPTQSECDPSYPDFCIPPNTPDLDCGEIQYKNFRVFPPDRHGFDRDNDGIGCEQ